MFMFYYNKQKKEHEKVIKALYESYPGPKGISSSDLFHQKMRLNRMSSRIIFAGMIRGEGNIYNWCVSNEKKFIYIDHAYLNKGYDQDPEMAWMRVTDSAFCWCNMESRPQDRWQKYFEERYAPIKPWMSQSDRSKILVLPPSLSTQWLFPESKLWLQRTLIALSKNTNKDVVIREKPYQPIINHNNMIVGKEKYDHDKTIDEHLDEAYMVATFNSAVAVKATILGIPVLTGDHCAARPMSIKLQNIDAPVEPPRSQWLNQLVYHQFKVSEMIDGTIWKMMDLV